jgi:hypothetical protein
MGKIDSVNYTTDLILPLEGIEKEIKPSLFAGQVSHFVQAYGGLR